MMPEVMVFGWPYSPLVGLTVSFRRDHTADSLLAAQVSCELSGAAGSVVAGLVHTLVLPGTRLNPVGRLAVSDTPECAVESPLLYHCRTRTVDPAVMVRLVDQVAPPSAEYNTVLVAAAEAVAETIVTSANTGTTTADATTHLLTLPCGEWWSLVASPICTRLPQSPVVGPGLVAITIPENSGRESARRSKRDVEARPQVDT
jgi:hypothetical protein